MCPPQSKSSNKPRSFYKISHVNTDEHPLLKGLTGQFCIFYYMINNCHLGPESRERLGSVIEHYVRHMSLTDR